MPLLFVAFVSPKRSAVVPNFCWPLLYAVCHPQNLYGPSDWPVVLSPSDLFMHKNLTRTKTSHTTFFKITSTKYPNFTVKPLYLLWCCRGEDNLGIGLLASKKAVQYISRSLVLAQSFLRYGVSKSTGQTTSKSP